MAVAFWWHDVLELLALLDTMDWLSFHYILSNNIGRKLKVSYFTSFIKYRSYYQESEHIGPCKIIYMNGNNKLIVDIKYFILICIVCTSCIINLLR